MIDSECAAQPTMADSTNETQLDNPVWSCLSTRHAHLAEGNERARRYRIEFSPLGGVVNPAASNVAALRELVGIGEELSIAGADPREMPNTWEVTHRLRIAQMIRREKTSLPETASEISALSATAVGDMLALVDLTHPGPFCERTIELGSFVGIRRRGRLLAMAGERMWIGDYREVSSVCTDPDAQGQGFARALLAHVINRMLKRGQTPFLHVDSKNEKAIAVYQALGFTRRAEFPLVHARKMR
jgi:predicted GNAT family acetyltransferase